MCDVLVASDLVSRGIDVVDVGHVIMFDIPDKIEDFVHRAGTTLVLLSQRLINKKCCVCVCVGGCLCLWVGVWCVLFIYLFIHRSYWAFWP